jgi:drug/metabolite transporter (DMT)-like permease
MEAARPIGKRTASGAPRSALRGIAFMVAGGACFAVMDSLVKWVSPRFAISQIIFFRSLFALLPIGVLAAREGGLRALRTARPGGQVLRSLCGLISLCSFVYAFGHMPLADAVGIGFSAPILITALSVPLLGESVGIRRWSAVLVGFVGVIIIVRPGGGVLQATALVAFVGTLFYALAMILIRQLGRSETTIAIAFYYSATCIVVAGAALPFQWATPDLADGLCLLALGIIGGFGQLFVTAAFRSAPVAIVAPFDYVSIIYVSLIGYAVWGDVPDTPLLVGAAILVASGLYILHRETRRGRGSQVGE